VIATASGDGLQAVRDYGADRVVDYQHEKFEDAAHDVDLVFDLIGGDTQTRSFAVLKSGGALISTVQAPDKDLAAAKHLKAERYMAVPNGGELGEIAALIDAGKVKVVVARTFPLAEASAAHRFLEDEHPRGKVVLIVGDA
jgi:NADPH:quinone reductase-like Zn-dependent oxidoreductase